MNRLERLVNEHLRDGCLKRCRDIRRVEFSPLHALTVDVVQHGGFQPAEAELIVALLRERTRKVNRLRISRACESIDLRAARIGKAEHARNLIKRFACRIIARTAHQAERLIVRHIDECRMPARDDKRDKGRHEIGCLKEIRKDMPLEMIHTDERHVERKRQCLCRRHTDKQRPHESGAVCNSDLIHRRKLRFRLVECLLDDGQNAQDMVARSNLRNNAAVFLMNRYLR